MLEILSPAGSPEGVVAAVQNGADAIYLGYGSFNARRNAKNFNKEDFAYALEYCRVRGVRAYLTLNTIASDRELHKAAEMAKEACRAGIDAIIVQDLGVMKAVRQAVPEVPVHASTQMGIHNLEGVKMVAAMGAKRAILARELSRAEIEYICKRSPIEIEVFVHGALCMSYSGQCYMSAVIGRRSGNRGLCAQPCRLNYSTGGHAGEYLLSLKDNCLVRYLRELETMGVKCAKIEGRMKRPEYSAIVTGIYARAAHLGKAPTADDMRALEAAFSRQGFTDGYYKDKLGADMFGVRGEEAKENSAILATARKNYLNGEFQRVPVRFIGVVRDREPIKLAAADDRGNTAVAYGPIPELAFHREITITALQTQLHKTGGTPFFCAGVKGSVEPGLSLPVSAFNELRRSLLTELMEKRKPIGPLRREGEYVSGYMLLNREEAPKLTVSVMKLSQLSREMAELRPHVLYIPVSELSRESAVKLKDFLEAPETSVALILPRVMHDNERRRVSMALKYAASLGITDVLAGNIGHIQFAKSHGYNVRGDYGLNVYNSQTLRALKDLGLKSAALSFELRLAEVRDLSKPIDTELIVYGRLPLMVTENCVIKKSMGACACDNFSGLKDRQGASFPVVPEAGCRNVILNSKKLFMADRREATASLGLWAERLVFTTENAIECVSVLKRYMGLGDYEPAEYTRGLYYRGVE